jgi:hypothetical protein
MTEDTDPCMCGHVYDEHESRGMNRCTIEGCACVAFETDSDAKAADVDEQR